MDVTKRIEELQGELDKGNQALVALANKQNQLREQLLKIAGAIQVLKELEPVESEGENGLKSV